MNRSKVRLIAALLSLCALAAQADIADIDLTEPDSFPIFNVPVRIGDEMAIVSFTPRKEPTTFVIDATNLTVTERKGFIGDRETHSLVIEQGNVRVVVVRGKDL
jgi:hypothetical protein